MGRRRSVWIWVCILVAMAVVMIQSPIRQSLGQRLAGGNNESFTAFVVADAHFGSTHNDQPSNEQIRAAMHHIYKRFPALDILWDAGDAHHSSAPATARGEWLTYLAGEVRQTPLYYTGGNHELDNFNGRTDPEERTEQLGSLAARPYYSLDIKNIHLIALPELIDVNYLTSETLAWLDLDLQLNQDKTVIIISHNAVTGTTNTQKHQVAYRRLANSDEILDRMERHQNIRAWIHGHNHTYEMVERDGAVFVSAGRMGGFNGDRKTDLKLKADDLGGIYIEVTRNQLLLRAYNASKQAFMDELEYPSLSTTLEFRTSLQPNAPASMSYGYGLARDGQKIPVYNHHLGSSKRELFVSGAPGPIFNDNPQFTAYSEDTRRSKSLNAISISSKERYEWLDPLVRLLPDSSEDPDASDEDLIVRLSPKSTGQLAYYRVAPNHTYTTRLKLDAMQGGQQVKLQAQLNDSQGTLVMPLPPKTWTLAESSQTLTYSVQLPALDSYSTIYTDSTSDRQLQLAVKAVFTKMEQPVTLEQFSLQMGEEETSQQPTVLINDVQYESDDSLRSDQYAQFDLPVDMPPRSVIETRAKGNGLLSFLVRETGIKWQVRNAMATQKENALLIGPMRKHFGEYRDIVIAPLGKPSQPYLNKLSHIEQAKVAYKDSSMEIELLEVDGEQGELTIAATEPPREVLGASDWIFENGLLNVIAAKNDRVTINF